MHVPFPPPSIVLGESISRVVRPDYTPRVLQCRNLTLGDVQYSCEPHSEAMLPHPGRIWISEAQTPHAAHILINRFCRAPLA